MAQCKELHPDSPFTNIFLCVLEKGHPDQHVTYGSTGENFYWSDDHGARDGS